MGMNAVGDAKTLSCRKGQQKGKKSAFGVFVSENNRNHASWENNFL